MTTDLKIGGFFAKLRLFSRMTAQKNNGSDKASSRAEFRLWFLVHFGFFIDPSLFSEMIFFLQSAQPAAISGNDDSK